VQLSTVKARPTHPAVTATAASGPTTAPLDLTDFKRDLSELTDRLGQAQDCL
jgi:peptide chain release factor 2